MAVRFDVIDSCHLFRLTRALMLAGESFPVDAYGTPLPDGFVRLANVPIMEAGTFRLDYPGHPPYTRDAFNTGSHWGQEVRPGGAATVTAVTDGAYCCLSPIGGAELDHMVLEVTGTFVPPASPTYLIPIVGTLDVGGIAIPNKQIARRDSTDPVDITVDGYTVAVWKRN